GGIDHIQAVATKAGIIRTEETFEGVIAKGVGPDYNWEVFKEFLVDGALPNFEGEINNGALVSQVLANRLQLKTGDSFVAFFFKEDDETKMPNQRKFTITGIYDSGFEELDASYIFIDIRHIIHMNKWARSEEHT